MVQLTKAIFDTRPLWNSGTDIQEAAGDILALLPETDSILSKLRREDAKMALGSILLKYWFMAKHVKPSYDARFRGLRLPEAVGFARRGHKKFGKPVGKVPAQLLKDGARFDFNVSHQAGIVVLVGSTEWGCPDADMPSEDRKCTVLVGADVVCVDERDQLASIDKKGAQAWIKKYESFFSAEDMQQMLDFPGSPEDVVRYFYAHFCYREAVLKMTGEALMAEWAKDLVIRAVTIPRPPPEAHSEDGPALHWGSTENQATAVIPLQQFCNVKLSITAFEEQFMIAVAASRSRLFPAQQMADRFQTVLLDELVSPLHWVIGPLEFRIEQ